MKRLKRYHKGDAKYATFDTDKRWNVKHNKLKG